MHLIRKKIVAFVLAILFVLCGEWPVLAEELTVTKGEFAARINIAMGYDGQIWNGEYEEYIGQAAVVIGRIQGYLSGDEHGVIDHNAVVTNAEAAAIFQKVTGFQTEALTYDKSTFGKPWEWAAPSLALARYLELPVDWGNPGAPIDRYNALSLINYMKAAVGANPENPYHVEMAPATENFYKWVNNPWLLRMAVEREGAVISRFSEAEENATGQIRGLIHSYADKQESYARTTDEWKIAEIYEMALNSDARNDQGIAPLASYFKRLDEAKNIDEVRALLPEIGRDFGSPVFFTYAVLPSAENSDRNELRISGPALALGNSTYYDAEDKNTSRLRESTRAYMADLLKLCGVEKEEAFTLSQDVFQFEMLVAEARKTETTEDENGRKKTPVTLTAPSSYKNLRPEEILTEMGFTELEKAVVAEPNVLRQVDAFFTEDNLETVKGYIKCILLGNVSDIMSEELQEIHNSFLEKNGILQEELAPERYAEQIVMRFMGNAVEKRYAALVVSERDKKEVELLTELIRESFRKRIMQGSFFTEETKAEAVKKLSSIRVKVGASHRFRDYSFLQIVPYVQDGSLFAIYRQLARNQLVEAQTALLNPVYKNEWHIPAYAVNAVYTPLYNDIIIPAGLLQEPFYAYDQSLEQKLGGIGVVIAHEMSHALYGEGSKYDKKGNEKAWWTLVDYTSFYQTTNRISAYFSDEEVMPEVYMDGERVLSEGVADISGLTCVLDILEDGKKGYQKQRFFEAYARALAMRADDSYVLYDALTTDHLPMAVRVNALVSLFDAFYEAYSVKEGDGMYLSPEKRVSVW